jgi:hypothetical protein
MVREILLILEQNAIAMVLIFVLWIILFDQKAIDRINQKPAVKKIAYLSIIIYYLLIIIEIIQRVSSG